jgi:hypothetical protein
MQFIPIDPPLLDCWDRWLATLLHIDECYGQLVDLTNSSDPRERIAVRAKINLALNRRTYLEQHIWVAHQ